MGPSQICECPFREPRVFEIALLMKKTTLAADCCKTKDLGYLKKFSGKDDMKSAAGAAQDMICDNPWCTTDASLNHLSVPIFAVNKADRPFDPLRFEEWIEVPPIWHCQKSAWWSYCDHTVIILAHCQCCYFQDLQPRRTSLWHKLSQAGGPPKSICRAKGLLWMPWT